MKLTVFQADKGDCLLLESRDSKRRILIDGGMRESYRRFVAPALGELARGGHALDLVYVSHVDQDHIAGVLQLFDDHAAWKIHEFQRSRGNTAHKPPASPRPPAVKEVWHNAFGEQVGDDAPAIRDALAATAAIAGGSSIPEVVEAASRNADLASSIPEAIRLSRRLSKEQLGIPLNQRFGNRLAFVRVDEKPRTIRLDPLRIAVIGPFESELEELREEWRVWLAKNRAALEKIRRAGVEDSESMGRNDARSLIELQLAQAALLGDRDAVTTPNLASLMLLVREGTKSLLLTGDGHSEDILKGLAFQKALDRSGRIHVDVLKFQHHGSEHNTDREFFSRVSADHYIFCGNGEHANPDLRVVESLLDSRLEAVAHRATHPRAGRPFRLWFNTSESATERRPAKEHVREVRRLVESRAARSPGRFEASFLEGASPSFEIEI
ncbi:MAG: MBL fold metallo-hydrolase [Isosphaeraceae bacterium]|nr:MBL fold metallo-hydrolase [Isosphaeraceae bacterium]